MMEINKTMMDVQKVVQLKIIGTVMGEILLYAIEIVLI